jgi:hypothetical protein
MVHVTDIIAKKSLLLQLRVDIISFCPEAEFLDEIQTKVLRVFLLAIHSHRSSFALRFIFFQTHAISYGLVTLLYSVKEKGGKPDGKP